MSNGSPRWRMALGIAGLLCLAACAGTPADAPAATSARARAAPALPVERFDGRYAGTMTLSPDRTRACPAAANEEREITVRNGRAVFLINPRSQQRLTGTIGPDGSVRMADSIDRNIATSGLFTAAGFRGEHRTGLCTYAVQMTRQS